MAETQDSIKTKPLTAAQRARVERNRQKALLLRQARLTSRPYQDPHGSVHKCDFKPPSDTGGGFYIEDDDDVNEVKTQGTKAGKTKVVERPGPLHLTDKLFCNECLKEFQDSYLFNNFDEPVCDTCKSADDKYELMTRTKAKDEFLLKDADLDKREPTMKYIVKKNPHNQRWGDMKLYLYCQIHARAMVVWGSEEELEQQRDTLDSNRDKAKQKKFDKKIKDLRNAVRSSLWKKDLGTHEHMYGDETYDEDDDMYSKTCSECGQTLTYEKM